MLDDTYRHNLTMLARGEYRAIALEILRARQAENTRDLVDAVDVDLMREKQGRIHEAADLIEELETARSGEV